LSELKGYAGKVLTIDLSTGKYFDIPTQEYTSRYLGGRGIAAKIYWDEVPAGVQPFDSENCLLLFTGPLCGIPRLAGSRWTVCGKSPATEPAHFSYSNLGGNWGSQLKFAGYDGLVVRGKADKPVYIYIDDNIVEIRDADFIWGKGAAQTREIIKAELGKEKRVLTMGLAGENLVTFASLLADNDASGSCGFGAVMGSKKLKAIVVKGSGSLKAAHPDKLSEVVKHIGKLIGGPDEYPLVPLIAENSAKAKREACYGCIRGCPRYIYEASDGTRGKYMCASAIFYQERAYRYYGQLNEVPFYANRLCDDYGLDTLVVENLVKWLSRCHKTGILDDSNTGIPLSTIGSHDFIETLVKKVALREGFGDVLARGLTRAAQSVSREATELITDYVLKADQNSQYDGRLYVTTGLLYAMEPRQPIQQLHEIIGPVLNWVRWAGGEKDAQLSSTVLRAIAKRFWGSEIAGDFSTYEGKAQAAIQIQNRQYAKECLSLCDFIWPILYVAGSEDHVGDPGLESQIYSSITGNHIDEEELYHFGERIFNLQRAIMIREGHCGREDDQLPEPFFTIPLKGALLNPECIVPGKNGETFSRKGAVEDRDTFEKMKTEYYQLRSWDIASGLQTRRKLEDLDLGDIAEELEIAGLLA
jgi:aldehyde:ferredoxin oxidoreductase